MNRLTKSIQWGLLVIVALMPLHAFLSVWLGHVFGHEMVIQAWKEVLLVILAGAAAILVIRDPTRLQRLRRPWVWSALGLILLAIIIAFTRHTSLSATAFGLKTDLEFLIAGLIAALVASDGFIRRLVPVILIGAAVVCGFDLLQIFVLPPDFLTAFGYGPNTILPYQHITTGTSALRFPSTLGGPNQLGTYLILPLCLASAELVRRRRWWLTALIGAGLISLIWTFSRSAWIGAASAVILTLILVMPRRWRRPFAITAAVLAATLIVALPVALKHGGSLQYFVLHSSLAKHNQANISDSEHALSLRDGLIAVLQRPFGHGLGTAGPATFHTGSINIIENYYLQIGYELGLVAVALFLICLGTLVYALLRQRSNLLAVPTAAAIIGISLVALVLPAWVDSSTALIAWICAGAAATGDSDV